MSSADEYTITDFAVDTTIVLPTHAYQLRTSAYYSAETVADDYPNATIVDIPTLDEQKHQELLQRVLLEGEVWTNDIPTGLGDLIEDTDLFTWNEGTDAVVTHVGVVLYRRSPSALSDLAITAELNTDHITPETPGTIEFRVTNRSDEIRMISSGPFPPFSVLWAEARDNEHSFLLWSEYNSSTDVSITDQGVEVNSVEVETPIDPGETITRTYEVRTDTERMILGAYEISGVLNSRLADEPPSEAIEWTVTFALRSLSHDEP